MRRRHVLVMLLVLFAAVAGAAGCGGSPSEEAKGEEQVASAGGSTTTADAAKSDNAAKGSTTMRPSTTTTVPKSRTTVKNRPDCQAFEKYSLALSAVAFAKPEKRAEVEQKANEAAANAKKSLPQFTSDIDTQLALTKKAATPGGLNQAEKDQLKKVGDNLTQWKKTTCL